MPCANFPACHGNGVRQRSAEGVVRHLQRWEPGATIKFVVAAFFPLSWSLGLGTPNLAQHLRETERKAIFLETPRPGPAGFWPHPVAHKAT